jgi:flagella basal body P-ring formation protein FlgA
MTTRLFLSVCFVCLSGGFALVAGSEPSSLIFQNAVEVDGEGVFLNQIVASPEGAVPVMRVANSPTFGQTLMLTRKQVVESLAKANSQWTNTSWTGSDRIQITRRTRTLSETDLLDMLRAALQSELVKDRGELELRLARMWTPVSVPDEALQIKLLDLPATGMSSSFVLRFELRSARESLGSWQTAIQMRIWRDTLVARCPLRRGQPLLESEFSRERRDVLNQRDLAGDFPASADDWELAESLPAGGILLARHIKLKAVVRRGQTAEAVLVDGALSVSIKVELLEDGSPGQMVRARNLQTKREVRGKVLNDQTIAISL